MPNILIVGQHYPMSILRYYKRGFEQLGVEVDSMGNTTGDRIPWVSVSTGQQITGLSPDSPTYQLPNIKGRYEESEWVPLLEKKYDLILNIDAGHHFVGRPDGAKKIIIGTDPHAIPGYPGRRGDCDWFVCMQKCYSMKDDIWLPFAYDAQSHLPPDTLRLFKHRPIDVLFVGNLYQNRKRDLEILAKAGINVDSKVGLIFDDFTNAHHQAKLSYGSPSLEDLPARFFETMAIGCPPITRVVPDMKEKVLGFVPMIHYIPADDPTSLVNNTQCVLDSQERWFEMVVAGWETVAPHTWKRRAEQLLQIAGLRDGDPMDFKRII